MSLVGDFISPNYSNHVYRSRKTVCTGHTAGKMFSVKVCVNTVKGYCKNVTCFGDVKKQTITAKLKFKFQF